MAEEKKKEVSLEKLSSLGVNLDVFPEPEKFLEENKEPTAEVVAKYLEDRLYEIFCKWHREKKYGIESEEKGFFGVYEDLIRSFVLKPTEKVKKELDQKARWATGSINKGEMSDLGFVDPKEARLAVYIRTLSGL